jgi:protein-tyrosine phosphatase
MARPIGVKRSDASRAATAIRLVLTHPAAMRIKRPLRDLSWLFRGAGLENPSLPDHVASVVFVCLGNICRSPFAALLAARLLVEAGRPDITVSSAGVRASRAAHSPAEACAAARQYGVCLDTHVPQLLTGDVIGAHDVVVVMDATLWHELRTSYAEFRDRIFLLPLYDTASGSAYERYNIADPFGKPIATFEACYRRIERALRRWLAEAVVTGDKRELNGSDFREETP